MEAAAQVPAFIAGFARDFLIAPKAGIRKASGPEQGHMNAARNLRGDGLLPIRRTAQILRQGPFPIQRQLFLETESGRFIQRAQLHLHRRPIQGRGSGLEGFQIHLVQGFPA